MTCDEHELGVHMDTLSIFQTLYTTTYRHLLSEAGLKGLLGAYPFIQQIWNLRRTDEVRIALVVRGTYRPRCSTISVVMQAYRACFSFKDFPQKRGLRLSSDTTFLRNYWPPSNCDDQTSNVCRNYLLSSTSRLPDTRHARQIPHTGIAPATMTDCHHSHCS
jgi:hypothetical protein